MQEVPAGRVLHALGLARRPGGIEDEERMLRVDPGRLAGVGLPLDHLVPPLVARRLHRHRRPGALVDDHVAHLLAAAHRERLVHRGLERDLAAAAELPVGGDDLRGAGVDDALLQALRRKSAEHHRVRRADARAGLHGDHDLDRHRHVDEHPVALLDAVRLQCVRELAHPVIQLLVGDPRDLAVVGLEDDRDLVGLRLEVPVEAVVGGVQLAVVEPLEERRVGLVEHFREWLVPEQVLARHAAPRNPRSRAPPRRRAPGRPPCRRRWRS